LDSISVHHQESSTVHTEIHTGYADCFLAGSQHNLYDLHLLQSSTVHTAIHTCMTYTFCSLALYTQQYIPV